MVMIITITDLIGKKDRVELRDATVNEAKDKHYFQIVPAGIEDKIYVGKKSYAGKCIAWGIATHPDAASFDLEITRIGKLGKPYFYVRMMARGA